MRENVRMSVTALVMQLQIINENLHNSVQEAMAITEDFEGDEKTAINSLRSLLVSLNHVHTLIGSTGNLPLAAVPIVLAAICSYVDAKKAVTETIDGIYLVKLRRDRVSEEKYQETWEDAMIKAEAYPHKVQELRDAISQLCEDVRQR